MCVFRSAADDVASRSHDGDVSKLWSAAKARRLSAAWDCVTTAANRPGSPPSPARCSFAHPLDDLIQVTLESLDVRFVLTKQLELEAICDLDRAIKVTSYLLVESEVGATLCVAHGQDCRGADAADSFDVVNCDTEMIEGLGLGRECRVVPCFLPSFP